ncbi:hypothetical protein D3C77_720380 [compost metagenome]
MDPRRKVRVGAGIVSFSLHHGVIAEPEGWTAQNIAIEQLRFAEQDLRPQQPAIGVA